MSLNTAAITSGIAALTGTGITIKDIDAIPDTVQDRDCPVMFPAPVELSGGYEDAPSTFGITTAFWICSRTLRYTYLHAQAGMKRNISEHYAAMLVTADLLIEKIMELNVANVDVESVSISQIGAYEDPAAVLYYGFTVDVRVREMVNA
jgi:hypothetical protein